MLSDRSFTLGIRMADFAIPPSEGDLITTDASFLPLGYDRALPVANFVIDNATPDGQGGSVLTLRKQSP